MLFVLAIWPPLEDTAHRHIKAAEAHVRDDELRSRPTKCVLAIRYLRRPRRFPFDELRDHATSYANGSSKSTFMKILGGELEPGAGSVAIDSP